MKIKNLSLLFFTIFLMLFLIEITLRITGSGPRIIHDFTLNEPITNVPNENLGSIITVSHKIKIDQNLEKILNNKSNLISVLLIDKKKNENSVVKNKFIRIYSSEFITVYLNKKINKNNAFKIINNAAGSNTSRLIKFLIMLVFRKVFKK